ncbi:MAG: hypothetical protein ACT4O2_03745 [Beijerinckiaceae bacterium]
MLAALNAHAPPHEITGVLDHAEGVVLTLRTRAGKIVLVDDSDAPRREQTGTLAQGNVYMAQGANYDLTGVLRAQTVTALRGRPLRARPRWKTASRSARCIYSPTGTSTGAMMANQLRPGLASMAYVLADSLRRIALQGTGLADAPLGTIRRELF